MNVEVKKIIDLFVLNRKEMKAGFPWENSMLYPFCALIYTEREKVIDYRKIKASKEILKEESGTFSNFRGINLITLSTMLSLEDDPQEKFNQIKAVHQLLKKEFISSQYLPLVAYIIVDKSNSDKYEDIVCATKKIYKEMKSNHPFITSSEDIGFACLFALNSIDIEKSIKRMESCYNFLKGNFLSSNAMQSLSHVLALGEEDVGYQCQRTLDIFEKLKANGLKYGTGYELSTLGALVLTKNDIDEIVRDVIEVFDYLKIADGFKWHNISKRQRIMYAALIVSTANLKTIEKEQYISTGNFLSNVTSMIIAQQAAMMAIIAASAASSSAIASSR